MSLAIKLFFEFFKIGLFAVGGGLATLPFLTDLGASTGLFTVERLMDMVAVSESTPGPMGINMATYVGFETLGTLGGIVTTLGIVTPSIVVIILVSLVMEKFKESPAVKNIFWGLRPASMGLICMSALEVVKNSLIYIDDFAGNILEIINVKGLIFAAVLLVFMVKVKIHPVFYVVIAAAVGVVVGF